VPFAAARLLALRVEVEHAFEGRVSVELRTATPSDAVLWERDWKPPLTQAGHPAAQWPWDAHIERAKGEDGRLCIALARADRLEALASLVVEEANSRLEEGANIIYVEYVGVAPEHLQPPLGRRAIKGLGGILVAQAVRLSNELGFQGRVGLHSKPEVEGFYSRLGFSRVALEKTPDGKWLYFETTPQQAEAILAER
jgi:hypothetical protein